MTKRVQDFSRKDALMILEWFKQKFGKSKFYNDPIRIRLYRNINSEFRGTYDEGLICIFLPNNRGLKDICKTIAHEYKHYLLCPNEYFKLQKKLSKHNLDGYADHPHEKRCFKFEEKWGNICFEILKNKLYKK